MWLKEIRKATGMTQEEVANIVGINRATLSKIETGSTLPSVSLAISLGKTLGFNWTRFYADPETAEVIAEA